MNASKDVRSLRALVDTGSTARVLNLARRHALGPPPIDPAAQLFAHSLLDRALIVKHRLRPHEQDWFSYPRSIATKVLIPIDPTDLNSGANAFMVGQIGCERIFEENLGISLEAQATSRDIKILEALDELPTLDPFLTREHLKRRGVVADESYFEISSADVVRMFDFVRQNIVPLVTLCFGGDGPGSEVQAQKLASKILAADMDASMEPLRHTLRMTEDEFLEGIFCWKGFLYYKWVLTGSIKQALTCGKMIKTVRVRGKATMEESLFIVGSRARLQNGIKSTCLKVRGSLDSYDVAFRALTDQANPVAFRDFLLSAPAIFFDVGERLGALQHITSFWNYRFPTNFTTSTAPELFDIFSDFENGLGLAGDRQKQSWG